MNVEMTKNEINHSFQAFKHPHLQKYTKVGYFFFFAKYIYFIILEERVVDLV